MPVFIWVSQVLGFEHWLIQQSLLSTVPSLCLEISLSSRREVIVLYSLSTKIWKPSVIEYLVSCYIALSVKAVICNSKGGFPKRISCGQQSPVLAENYLLPGSPRPLWPSSLAQVPVPQHPCSNSHALPQHPIPAPVSQLHALAPGPKTLSQDWLWSQPTQTLFSQQNDNWKEIFN